MTATKWKKTLSACRGRAWTLAWVCVLGVGLSGCKDKTKDALERAQNAVFEKRPNDALLEYRRALDLLEGETSGEAQLQRARALKGAGDVYYLELRKFADAVKVYEELLAQAPDTPEALESRLQLADLLHSHFHDARGAINHLTKAIASNPPQAAELVYRFSKLYFELADYKQSQLEAEQLVQRYEASAYADDAMLLLGQAQSMEGKSTEAARTYAELVRRYPESELAPHAHFEMGKLSAELDKPEEAIEHWVEALKRHPDPKLVQAAILRVRRRMAETTPRGIGKRAAAFDLDKKLPKPKTSLEAMGAKPDGLRDSH